MANMTWQITPDDMLYATVARAIASAAPIPLFPVDACTEISTEPTSYNSDTVVSYEAGTKDRFLNNNLQVSGSVYYLEWNNIQQAVTLAVLRLSLHHQPGQRSQQRFRPAGRVAGRPTPSTWISASATPMRYYTSTSVAAGLILAVKGDKLPGNPWTVSLGAQYTASVIGPCVLHSIGL